MHNVRCVAPSMHVLDGLKAVNAVGLSCARSIVHAPRLQVRLLLTTYSAPDYRTAPYKSRPFLVLYLLLDQSDYNLERKQAYLRFEV